MKVQMTFLVGVVAISCLGIDMNAYKYGAKAKIVYRVIDDEGVPVSNARVQVWFRTDYPELEIKDCVLATDTNGMFVAEGKTNERVSIGVDMEGYYHTFGRVTFRSSTSGYRVVDGKWQPYGETRTVVLKRIKNPSVMLPAKGENRRGYPEDGAWAGYDLERHDWVAPIGDGVCEDMKIRFVTQRFSDVDFARTMDVSFADIPHGGAYKMAADEFSEFKTVYSANTNAAYLSTFKYEFKHEGRKLVRDELAKDEYLVFRTRTTVNPDGSLKSAHYGVIMGNWKFFEPYGMGIGRTLFNPTPNDTNLEDAETARKSRLGYKQQLEFERRRKAGK